MSCRSYANTLSRSHLDSCAGLELKQLQQLLSIQQPGAQWATQMCSLLGMTPTGLSLVGAKDRNKARILGSRKGVTLHTCRDARCRAESEGQII